jgi:uncharacterized membrane protein YraQ (UPF0718 family)
MNREDPPALLDATPSLRAAPRSHRWLRWLLTLGLVALAVGTVFGDVLRSGAGTELLAQQFQTFVTIFLGIFIEAAPFLLAGSLVSGLIAVFVDHALVERYMPRNAGLGAVAGAALGLLFPVCECGVVPVTRRLYEKGLPMSIGIAFLLAAPVINPVVLFSTHAAFGFGPIFWGRIGATFAIAVITALVFHRARPEEVLLPSISEAYADACCTLPEPVGPLGTRLRQALNTAGDDFIDMGRYLVVGSLLAASMQTLVPQSALLAIGQTPVLSVATMQVLAFVLSVCSTVDAFLALAFTGTFTSGAIVAFLVFGPMVDIKSSLMFLGVFRRRAVVYLILLPLLLSMLVGVAWNLNFAF